MSDKDGLTDEERLRVELLTRPDTMTLEQWQASFPSAPQMNWQPIGTAPQDGTEVILFYPHLRDDGFVTAGHYYRNDGGDGPYWYADLVNGGASPPTHWMPLPEPPKE